MPTQIEWSPIALHLALTVIASAAIGINRGGLDRPVGLRTTMLVALAAAISMIRVNVLLPTAGKPNNDSFVILDLMSCRSACSRVSGLSAQALSCAAMNLVQGVTTAATSMVCHDNGAVLCGGQLGLGLAALGLTLVVLWCLKWVELRYIDREHRAELIFAFETGVAIAQRLAPRFVTAGLAMKPCSAAFQWSGSDLHNAIQGPLARRTSVQRVLDLVHEFGEIA